MDRKPISATEAGREKANYIGDRRYIKVVVWLTRVEADVIQDPIDGIPTGREQAARDRAIKRLGEAAWKAIRDEKKAIKRGLD